MDVNTFIVILKIIIALIGLLCLYFAFFAYETEQGKIQNKLEEWWVKIDDTKEITNTSLIKFLRRISLFTTISINKIFGEKIFSFQSAWVSVFYLNGVITIYFAFSSIILDSPFGTIKAVIISVFGMVMIILAALPLFIKSKKWIKWGCISIILVTLFSIIILIVTYSEIWIPYGNLVMKLEDTLVSGLIAYSVCTFLCMSLIGFFRWSIQKFLDFNSIKKIIISILLQIIFASTLVYIPTLIYGGYVPNHSAEYYNVITYSDLIGTFPETISFINLFSVFPLSLFIILLISVPLNRFIWSIVCRPIYTLAQYKIVTNKSFMYALAVFFIGLSFKLTQLSDNFITNQSSYKPDTPNNKIPICTSIGLNGSVQTRGTIVYAWYEWGTTPELNNSTPKWIIGQDTQLNYTLTNLVGNTKYYFKIVGKDEHGNYFSGELKSFITPSCQK